MEEGGVVLIEDVFGSVSWVELGTQHLIPALELINVRIGTLETKGRAVQ